MTDYFTCPKCGGHHFGRDIQEGTVKCHNATDGGALTYFDETLKIWRPRGLKMCNWRGAWPDNTNSRSLAGGRLSVQ